MVTSSVHPLDSSFHLIFIVCISFSSLPMFVQAEKKEFLSDMPQSALPGYTSWNLTSLHGQRENKGDFTMCASVGGETVGHCSEPQTFSPGFISGWHKSCLCCSALELVQASVAMQICSLSTFPLCQQNAGVYIWLCNAGSLLLSPLLDSGHKTARKLTGQQHSLPSPSITKKTLSISVLLLQIFQFYSK